LSAEQLAAVEALTRGLVNKFLHPPMQALKQAAREHDAARLEALCETWSLPAGSTEHDAAAAESRASAANSEDELAHLNENSEARRP
jgi:glutamyl-tRNA reductase